MEKGKIIRIVALIAAIIVAISSIFIIRGCSAPPKYEEIKSRFEQLVNDSHKVNEVIFGKGLPTYERVSDPKSNVKVYNTGEMYFDDGEEKERKVWYYRTLDEKNEIYAFRSSYIDKYAYVFVSDKELGEDELKTRFPAIDGVSAPEGKAFYSELYRTENSKKISYLVPYQEVEYEFYYTSADPDDYDFIRADSTYRTIDEIKTLMQTVYSRNYSISLYSALFDGIASGDTVLKARYAELSSLGASRLAQSNTYEPLFSEQRVYLFDTAQVVKWGSDSKRVIVSVQTYLPSSPKDVKEVKINLVLQDGAWYLDSPTF